MYVKKITSFCQVLKKMHTKEHWFLFSASWCTLYISISPKHGCSSMKYSKHNIICLLPWFSTFFYHVPKTFCQEGDVPTIKILLKNTKSMHVYYDFFHDICSSQYEYMSISLKLNNITFQSRKKGFRENQGDIYDR